MNKEYADKLGQIIFAIETNLQVVARRNPKGIVYDCCEAIQLSLEQAKELKEKMLSKQ